MDKKSNSPCFRDFSGKGYILPLSDNCAICYVSVNPVFLPKDGKLTETNSYFIYVLHPVFGSTNFIIRTSQNQVIDSDDMPDFIDHDLLTIITTSFKNKFPGTGYISESIPGFILSLNREEVQFYASVNELLEPDGQELMPTGIYLVYLLHPIAGSCSFTMEEDLSEKWFSRDAPDFVEKDIISEIGTKIQFREPII